MNPSFSKEKLTKIGKFILEVFYNVAIIMVLVVVMRSYIISPFKVLGESMNDTLLNQQLILINKWSYLTGEPDRGDVIVFLPPPTERDKAKFELTLKTNEAGEALELDQLKTVRQDSYCQKSALIKTRFCREGVKEGDLIYTLSLSEADKISGYNWSDSEKRQVSAQEVENNQLIFNEPDKDYRIKIYNPNGADHFVKRIIGLPGDTLKFEGNSEEGLVYLKKAGETEFEKINEPYLNLLNADSTYLPERLNENIFVVPEGMYFGMGDNRGGSNDSRSFFDPVTKEHTPFIRKDQMSGKVMMVLLPLWDFKTIKTQSL